MFLPTYLYKKKKKSKNYYKEKHKKIKEKKNIKSGINIIYQKPLLNFRNPKKFTLIW